jgi:NADH dehydrogenase FAD-containing subunit
VAVLHSDLVIATGSVTNETLIKGTEFAYTLKHAEDAVRIKQAIVQRAQGRRNK